MLGLLVALVSVLALGLPPVIRELESSKKESDIWAAIVEIESPTALTAFISNIGDGSAAITKASIDDPGKDSTTLYLKPVHGAQTIEANEAKIIRFELQDTANRELPILKKSDKSVEWRLSVYGLMTNAKSDITRLRFHGEHR